MRVVVVGAQSYLGFHLTKALYESGYEVTAADFFSDSSHPTLTKFSAFFGGKVSVMPLKTYRDLFDAGFRPEAVINILMYKAALSAPADGEMFLGQHAAFEELVSLVKAKSCRSFLNIAMADSIYGHGPIVPFDERALSLQPNLHGASALFAENYLSAWTRWMRSERRIATKPGEPGFFTYACVRMGEVFGPAFEKGARLPGYVGELSDSILSGKLPHGATTASRDLLYIEDAVSAVMACFKKLEDTQIDDVFNVGSGVEMRDAELVQTVLRNFHELGSDPDAAPAVQNSLKLTSGGPPAIPSDDKPARFCLECTKFRAYFGWRPRHDIFRSLKTSVEESFST